MNVLCFPQWNIQKSTSMCHKNKKKKQSWLDNKAMIELWLLLGVICIGAIINDMSRMILGVYRRILS